MNYEDLIKLINNIIENEFLTVSKYLESEFTHEDETYKSLRKEEDNAFNELLKVIDDNATDKIDDFDVALNNKMRELCRFYFKTGVFAGLSKLSFLKDIYTVE